VVKRGETGFTELSRVKPKLQNVTKPSNGSLGGLKCELKRGNSGEWEWRRGKGGVKV